MVAFTATVGFFIAQLLELLSYPWDEIMIYGFSLCIPIPFLLEILALHCLVSREKRYWTHAAVLLSACYAVFVISNYVTQLGTVIPMTLRGRAAEVQTLIQTPHSMFWNYDAVGYIFMGLTALAAVPALEQTGFQKRVRVVFLLHALATPLIAFVYFYPGFSEAILLIALPWGLTAPASMLVLALLFRRNGFDSK